MNEPTKYMADISAIRKAVDQALRNSAWLDSRNLNISSTEATYRIKLHDLIQKKTIALIEYPYFQYRHLLEFTLRYVAYALASDNQKLVEECCRSMRVTCMTLWIDFDSLATAIKKMKDKLIGDIMRSYLHDLATGSHPRPIIAENMVEKLITETASYFSTVIKYTPVNLNLEHLPDIEVVPEPEEILKGQLTYIYRNFEDELLTLDEIRKHREGWEASHSPNEAEKNLINILSNYYAFMERILHANICFEKGEFSASQWQYENALDFLKQLVPAITALIPPPAIKNCLRQRISLQKLPFEVSMHGDLILSEFLDETEVSKYLKNRGYPLTWQENTLTSPYYLFVQDIEGLQDWEKWDKVLDPYSVKGLLMFLIKLLYFQNVVVPLCLGDVALAQAEFETAIECYASTLDYEYLNQYIEKPIIEQQKSEASLKWASYLHQQNHLSEARERYLLVQDDIQQQIDALQKLVEEQVSSLDALVLNELEATEPLVKFLAKERFIELQKLMKEAQLGVNYIDHGLGYKLGPKGTDWQKTEESILWDFNYLRARVLTLAGKAKQREDEYTKLMDKIEERRLSSLGTNLAIKNIQESLDIAREKEKQAQARFNVANLNLNAIQKKIDQIVKVSKPKLDQHMEDIQKLDLYKAKIVINRLTGEEEVLQIPHIEYRQLQYAKTELEYAQTISYRQELAALNEKAIQEREQEIARYTFQYAQAKLNLAKSIGLAETRWLARIATRAEIVKSLGVWYLQQATQKAFLMQQSYNFLTEFSKNEIRFDEPNFGSEASSKLIQLLDSEFDPDYETEKEQPEQELCIDFFTDFPSRLEEMQKTGKTTFTVSQHFVDLEIPGSFERKVKQVRIELTGLSSNQFSMTLTNSSFSFVRVRSEKVAENTLTAEDWLQVICPMKEKRNAPSAVYANHRFYVFGGTSEQDWEATGYITVETYDPDQDVWSSELKPMSSSRIAGNAVVVGDEIYLIGGKKAKNGSGAEETAIAAVDVYHPSTNIWINQKTSLPSARWGLGATEVNGKIYAIGGVIWPKESVTAKYWQPKNNVDVYDPVADRWSNTNPLVTPTAFPAVVTLDSVIYVIGGYEQPPTPPDQESMYYPTSFSRRVQLLDLKSSAPNNQWLEADHPMPTGRWGHAATVVNNKILVAGGVGPRHNADLSNINPKHAIFSDVLRTVEEYDPATGTWTTKAPMPTPRKHFSLLTLDGRVYAIGGEGQYGQALSTVDVYNPLANHGQGQWETTGFVMKVKTHKANSHQFIMGGGSRQPDKRRESGKLQIFEGTGIATQWTLEINSTSLNDSDRNDDGSPRFEDIDNVFLYIKYSCYFDRKLKEKVEEMDNREAFRRFREIR